MNDYIRMIEYATTTRHVAKTPRRISPEIESMCATLSQSTTPVFHSVAPRPNSLPAKCYWNVHMECQEAGGTMRFGWLIWEMPGVYLTAEHHAVVERDGRLIDVTPQLFGETTVLFLPLEDRSEEPSNVPNRYMPLSNHDLVLRAVRLMEENQAIIAAGRFDSQPYRRNDEESARLMDEYFHVLQVRSDWEKKKLERSKKKAARKRR
jgi:hypothetical protein